MSRITFLGTGTSMGVPMIGCHCEVCSSTDFRDKRLRTSALIEHNGVVIVIDTGMDFRYQMLRSRTETIDAVIFTHSHKDHSGGLDDVRAFNYSLQRDIDIYAEQHCMEVIKKDYDYAFVENKYPGVPDFVTHVITEEKFMVKGVEVTPIRGMHYKLPVLGYRIGDISYITDMNYIADEEIEKIKGSKLLVITALRHDKHISHFSLSESIEVAKQTEVPLVYFTHMSHLIGLHEEQEKRLPPNMHFAYDELILDI